MSVFDDAYNKHRGWVLEQRDKQRRLLDQVKAEAKIARRIGARSRRIGRRSFTDAELIAAHAECGKTREIAERLQCDPNTVRYHAKRLGLKLSALRLAWSPIEDEMVRACGRGNISMTSISIATGHTVKTICRHAIDLGVVLGPIVKRPHPTIRAAWDDGSCQISVRGDRLLQRLRRVHGAPRAEVYPGSVRAA